MGFTIPNAPDASIPDQSEPDSVDFQALGNRTSGVISGCAVSAAASPDQTVSVAAGEVVSNGVYRTVAAASISLGQGDSSSPRFDLVVVNSAGALAARSGTAGSNATFPALASGDVLLAAVYRAAGTGDVITSSRIIDKTILQPSNLVRSGSGAPSNSVGAVGDVYINTALSSNSGQSQYWVKATSASWENLAEYTVPETTLNTANTLVRRDASGNFSAGTITATGFSGPISGAVTGNVTGNLTGNVTGNLTGTASNATLAAKASTLAQGGANGAAMTFNWSGQPGTPSYVWGSNDGTNHYVWTPANFSVNYATSAGNSGTVAGLSVHSGRNNEANKVVRTDGSGYLQVGYINSSNGNEGNNSNPARVWGTNGSDDYMRSYLVSALSVGSATTAGTAASLNDGTTIYYMSTGTGADTIARRSGGDGVLNANYFAGAGTATVATGNSSNLRRRSSDGYFLIEGSRREYKKDIQPLSQGVSLVNALTPVKFKWKKEYSGPDSENTELQSLYNSLFEYGFIVEDVAAVDNNLVSYMDDNDEKTPAPMMWQQNGVIALLVKAVQELSAEVEALKAAK
jgi:hypothetical protein